MAKKVIIEKEYLTLLESLAARVIETMHTRKETDPIHITGSAIMKYVVTKAIGLSKDLPEEPKRKRFSLGGRRHRRT